MGRGPREQGARARVAEPAREQGCGEGRVAAEAGQEERVPGDPDQGTEEGLGERAPRVDERCEEPRVAGPVGSQRRRRRRDVALHDDSGAVGEGVRERRGRCHPLHAERRRVEGAQEGRDRGEGVDGGADVVTEPRQGQRLGAAAAPDPVRGLDDVDGPAPLRQRDRGGQTVGSGPDDHRVMAAHPPAVRAPGRLTSTLPPVVTTRSAAMRSGVRPVAPLTSTAPV